MSSVQVAFVGFGEVAAVFSATLGERGAGVAAYDLLLDQAQGLAALEKRALTGGIAFRPLAEAIAGADYVLSTVTIDRAEDAAHACAQHMKPGQVYLDLNATSPAVKRRIAAIAGAAGAEFVEGAVLGAVGVTGAATRILLGGERGPETARVLSDLGLDARFYSADVGKASAFKMLRSVFSKGLEALVLEFLIAGRRAGLEEDLWREVRDLLENNPFGQVAANWVRSHALAHERRYHEMVQVVEVLRELGLEPVMTAGTEAVFKRSLSLNLAAVFVEKPETMDEVIDVMDRRLGAAASPPPDWRPGGKEVE
jgi:3-hydroxyisobutyrate dehydrogenase-like beta-hydroxyacid dehydrogenase